MVLPMYICMYVCMDGWYDSGGLSLHLEGKLINQAHPRVENDTWLRTG